MLDVFDLAVSGFWKYHTDDLVGQLANNEHVCAYLYMCVCIFLDIRQNQSTNKEP